MYIKIKQTIEELKTTKDSVDTTRRTQYSLIVNKMTPINSAFMTKKAEIGYSLSGFQDYQNKLTIDITSYNMTQLIDFSTELATIKAEVESESYASAFTSNGGVLADLTKFKIELDRKIKEVDKEREKQESAQMATALNLDTFETEINNIITNLAANKTNNTWLEDSRDKLTIAIRHLDNILATDPVEIIKNRVNNAKNLANCNLPLIQTYIDAIKENQRIAKEDQKEAERIINDKLKEVVNFINDSIKILNNYTNIIVNSSDVNAKKTAASQILSIENNIKSYKEDIAEILISYNTPAIQRLFNRLEQMEQGIDMSKTNLSNMPGNSNIFS